MAIVAKLHFSLLSCACLAVVVAAPAAAQTVSFEDLGDVPGGFGTSRALAISGDGGVIAGYAYDMSQTPAAVRWTESGGIEQLGYIPGGVYSYGYGISADGGTVVGSSGAPFQSQASRWTAAGGMQGLGFLPGGSSSEAFDVSGDGSVAVGWSNGTNPGAFRWMQGTGMVWLGVLPGSTTSTAYGVSDDGAVIVGYSRSGGGGGGGGGPPRYEAFRWTQETGMLGLGDLGGNYSIANDVSGDGHVVVGVTSDGARYLAFRWTEASGMVGLGLAPGASDGNANAANFDGTVIVGDDTSGHATVWTELEGTRFVADILTTAGIVMSDWNLQTAQGVSADGRVIVGFGDRISGASGNIAPWIARLDLGIISLSDLNLSLHSMTGVAQSAQQVESGHLSGLIDLASAYGAPDAVGAFSVWGGLSLAHYNILGIDPEARQGDIGLTYQLSSSWRLGAGVRWGGREDDVLVFDGASDSAYAGLGAFGAYEPEASGLRIYSAFAANWIENEIERGYVNGATPVSSHGELDGFAYGAALRIGWAAPLGEAVIVTPFLSYEAGRVELGAYTETSGPFPAHFDDATGNLDIARLGAQLDVQANAALRLWVTGAYASRMQEKSPTISGEVLAFSMPFAIEGAELNSEWGEASLSGQWQASNRTRLQLGLQVSSDGDTEAHYGARVSAIIAL